MKDEDKTKERLIRELVELRQRIVELGAEETERKRAEEALRESEERLRMVVQNMPVMLDALDADNNNIIVWNQECERVTGYSAEEIVGNPRALELLYPDTAYLQRMLAEWKERGSDFRDWELTLTAKDGSVKTVAWSNISDQFPIPDWATWSVGVDVTERKRAEEVLQQRATQLALLNDIGGQIATVLDLDEVLDRAVRLMRESFGYHHVAVFLLDRERGELAMGARAGDFAALFPPDHRQKLGQGMVGWVGLHGQTLLANDVDAEPRYICFYPAVIPTRSELCVPIRVGEQIVGVLDAQSPQLNAFDENDVMVMETLADQIAVAMENARLYQATQRELAERKRVMEALRESEERYRRLIESSPELIAVHSEGKIVYINAAGVKLLGATSPEEFVGKPIVNLVHPDYRESIKERVQQGYGQEKAAPPIEEKFIRPDGQIIDVETTAVPITYQGKPAILAVVSDITERKRAEEALQESEEKYRLHFENVSDVIYSIDPEFRILNVSPSVEKVLGYRPEELIGKPVQDLNLLAEEYLERAFSDAMRVLAGERVSSSVYEFIAKDGTRKFGEVSGAPLVRDGEVIALVSVARDITERRRLEEQLRQAQKLESIGQLAAGIAHDFNNLLTPIGGFADLLLGKAPEGSKEREYLRQIQVAAQRAAALTHQLRLFSRQEEGERRPVQLNSVIEETRDLLERSIPKEITIELHLEPELWAVEADPSQLSQMLTNLCVNARDAMLEGGTLTLETRNMTLDDEYARLHLGAQPGDYVQLSVSDTGCGMSSEVQAQLFEPFFTTKEPGKGTGLGLAVVYGVVEEHNGFINVYSQEGRGSTFHIYLPAIESAVEEGEVEVVELPIGTETILVVDDEEAVRALGQRVLELCGYTVLMAENGLQALDVYQAHRGEIALVVLDVGMPQMGGRECLQRLREMDSQVKVLISTGYTAKSLSQELVARGALGVVEKPFVAHEFATAVRTALDQSP